MRNITDDINRIIIEGAASGMTREQFFAREIGAWKRSKKRREQIKGTEYYENEHDILGRRRKAIGKDGRPIPIENVPNHRVIDNQYAKMVDQKVNYLLGKPLTFDTEDEAYEEALKEVFDSGFQRTFRSVGEGSMNGAITWLHPYYDEEGKLCFKRFEPFEILPFWKDVEHKALDCALRVYEVDAYKGATSKKIEYVEVFTAQGVERYILKGGALTPDPDNPGGPYVKYKGYAFSWGRIPLIPFRYNSREIPLIRRAKSLQDSINLMLSNFINGMEEDGGNTILIIKGYPDTDLGELRQNLMTYRAIKVHADKDIEGGVEALRIEVNAENYEIVLKLLKKALIENARGYDAKDDRMSGQPNQMNIQSMYSDIDLDASGMEVEYQAAMEELLWFVNKHFEGMELTFKSTKVEVIFNKDILINETEVIENIQKSVGILSEETLVKQHPWASNAQQEMERKRQEERQTFEDEYQGAFARGQPEEAVDGKRTA